MTSATAWKIATVSLGLCCLFLAYRVMDLGISRTYSAASAESDARDLQALRGLLEKEWQGLPESQVVSRLQAFVASRPSGSVVLKRLPEEANSIYFEGFRFEFRDGKLYKVA
eukprot:TRINITY_DN1616_c0_g1_i5.p2 TRINITY_DN1616_c0_g1~~TRINITY_DN1616_c0_g1_i5.p2  ORF type:complete len:112 (-),score=12.70 TRINITY_DN1616_c0_g1_i5:816-1151(-)